MHRRGSKDRLHVEKAREGAVGRSSVVLVGWIGLLLLGLGVGHALGGEVLSVPSAEVTAWRTWAATTDPLVLTMALLRVGALGVAWYLLATTLLAVVARGLRLVRLIHLADAIAAPTVRRLVHRSMGVVVASAIATSVAAPTAHAADPPPVAVVEEGGGVLTMRGVVPGGPTSMEGVPVALPWERLQGSRVQPADDDSTATASSGRAVAPRSAERASSSDPGPDGMAALVRGDQVRRHAVETAHIVRPGESLWAIAEVRLEQAWGREPRDVEVVPYWREVIERNRDRLVVADEPDLILPGQELLLPPVARP